MTILWTALAFLKTPLGRYVAVALAVTLAVGIFYLYAYNAGAAAAVAAAAAASAAAIARANKARAKVDHSAGAAARDPADRSASGETEVAHMSSCAVHNMPAYPAGPCDCGAVNPKPVAGRD